MCNKSGVLTRDTEIAIEDPSCAGMQARAPCATGVAGSGYDVDPCYDNTGGSMGMSGRSPRDPSPDQLRQLNP